MAFSVNRAILVGNITKDPELKYSPSGKAVLTMNIATNRSVKKNDQWNDMPTYHRVIVWDKLAEWIAKDAHKGDRIYIEGRIDNRSWDGQDGVKHYISEVVAETVIPMNKRAAATKAKPAEPIAQDQTEEPEPTETGDEKVNPDDIPF